MRGLRVEVRGEVASMTDSFREMAFSLVLAVLLVYLVMVAQFASWLDPLIMIVVGPARADRRGAMLWATNTSLNIQSCMGVLMMVGISVSNSVLLVEFANRERQRRQEHAGGHPQRRPCAAAADPDDDRSPRIAGLCRWRSICGRATR